MKTAAYLTLALAMILAIWALSDYANNERSRERHVAAAFGNLFENSGRDMARINRDEDLETQDGLIGVAAFAVLIGSVVMFSQARKNKGRDGGVTQGSGSAKLASEARDFRPDALAKKCPDCAETIKMEALVCHFCDHRFQPAEVEAAIQHAKAAWEGKLTREYENLSRNLCPNCGAYNAWSDLQNYLRKCAGCKAEYYAIPGRPYGSPRAAVPSSGGVAPCSPSRETKDAPTVRWVRPKSVIVTVLFVGGIFLWIASTVPRGKVEPTFKVTAEYCKNFPFDEKCPSHDQYKSPSLAHQPDELRADEHQSGGTQEAIDPAAAYCKTHPDAGYGVPGAPNFVDCSKPKLEEAAENQAKETTQPQQSPQALRLAMVSGKNAEFQKPGHPPGYAEIVGDAFVIHQKAIAADSFPGFFSSPQFQQIIPAMKQAGIATLTYTNDANLTFVYDVSAGQVVAPSLAHQQDQRHANGDTTLDCLQMGPQQAERDFEYTYVAGTLKNTCGTGFSGVEVNFELIDDDGNRVGTAHAFLQNMKDGETWKFRAAGTPSAGHLKFGGVQAYGDSRQLPMPPKAIGDMERATAYCKTHPSCEADAQQSKSAVTCESRGFFWVDGACQAKPK